LIADEPTTALDVTIQAQILDLIRALQEDLNSGVLLITHDLAVVADKADHVTVMNRGESVEIATVEALLNDPQDTHTSVLLNSLPHEEQMGSRLHVIEGVVPALNKLDRDSCRFAPRIPWIPAEAHEHNPELREISPEHYVRCTCYKDFYLKSDPDIGVQVEQEQMENSAEEVKE